MIETLKEKWKEIEARKRAELEASLERDEVADPISSTLLISLAVSSAISAASYVVSRALAPKPPRGQQGKLTGSIQLQNSEQGIFIPEIYGGSPTTSLVAGANPTYQNLANVTVGGSGSITKTSGGSDWNAGASHNVSITAGQDAFFQFTVGTGYATAGLTLDSSPTSGNTDFLFAVQWNPDGSITIKYSSTLLLAAVTTWVAGDVFRLELRSGRFRLYKNSAEIVPPNFIFPAPSYPLFMGIAMQFVGAGVSASKVQIGTIGAAPNSGRGGIKVPAIIVWSSGIRKIVSTTQIPTGGGKGGGARTQTVDNITYDIDLGLMFCRGPASLIRLYANADILIDQFAQSPNPSGVHDPTVGADPVYDPELPPDPTLHHALSFLRVDADIPFDGDNVGTGTIQGGGSSFAIYPGNNTQDPDPTIEADIDGKYGAGSTPAYRNHSLAVLTTLSLSRWGGVVPNVTAVWEHETLRTLDLIFASLCERVGVLTADGDYDFTDIAIPSRGLLISGRPFQPKEVIGSPDLQLAYNYFVTEADGQVIGYTEGNEPSVTIPDTEIGWLEGDAELPDIAPEVDSMIAAEISLPREVHVKSLDPDNDWEPNTASAMRQITDGSAVELLEIQICQLSDERREVAQRKLYRDYVAGSAHKFTLSWKYLYLHTGYKITITRAEGFTHVIRLTSIDGGIGVLNCEGVALEPETFNQPANGVFPPGYIPPQPIPAMTVVALLDTPLLRDGDETNNYGIGFYMAGVPRTGVQLNWTGFALYVNRNSTWTLISSSNLPATIGTIVSVTGLNTSDTSVIDRTGVFTVDLYGTTATLSSITETDMLLDATRNLALFGAMITQFAGCTQVPDFPNRWQLSTLLNGRRGTEDHVSDSFVGKRFVLIDGAVKFVPAEVSDINNNREYRAVTNGQSLGDAATVEFAWTGMTLRPLSPANLKGDRDATGNLLIEWTRRSRVGSGMVPGSDVPLAEEAESYDVEILNVSNVVLRTIRVSADQGQPAVLIGGNSVIDNPLISGNNVLAPGADNFLGYVKQQLGLGSFIEARLNAIGNDGAVLGVASPSYGPLVRDVSSSTWPPSGLYYSRADFHPTLLTQEGITVFAEDSTTQGIFPTLRFSSGSLGAVEAVRLRIEVGSRLRYYWDYAGSGSVPFYESANPPPEPLIGFVYAFFISGTGSSISNVIVGKTFIPSTVYTTEMQIEDFGSVQSSVRVRVSQLSGVVGRGPYVESEI